MQSTRSLETAPTKAGSESKRASKQGKKVYPRSRARRARENAIQRCYNPRNKDFHRYGARGIRVCVRWLDRAEGLRNFLADMGEPQGPEFSLDRINPAGHYTPENCRWATFREQRIHKRDVVPYPYRGEEKTLVEWAEEFGMPFHTLYKRVRRLYWSIEDALETPVRRSAVA